MPAAQGNLFGGVIAAGSDPQFIYQLPAADIAYWSVNLRIAGNEANVANVGVYVNTTNDPGTAFKLDGAQIGIKGSFSLECLLRSGGDCIFVKSDQPITVHVEGVFEPTQD